ncbi:MAG: hypothetical protein ACK56I_16735, partial [bacterium]
GAPGSAGAYGDSTWRDKVATFTQVTAPVICENKWDGRGLEMIDPKTDQMHITCNDLRIDVTSADKGDFVTEYAKQKNFEAAQNKGFSNKNSQ